jgi:hypothetical protein
MASGRRKNGTGRGRGRQGGGGRADEEHALFFRGQIYKRLGNGQRAAHDFRCVLHANPKRHDAALELRLFLARRGAG